MLLPNSRAEGEAPDYDPGVTGQYLAPFLARSPVIPAKAGIQSSRAGQRRSKDNSRGAEADQPDLISAKCFIGISD